MYLKRISSLCTRKQSTLTTVCAQYNNYSVPTFENARTDLLFAITLGTQLRMRHLTKENSSSLRMRSVIQSTAWVNQQPNRALSFQMVRCGNVNEIIVRNCVWYISVAVIVIQSECKDEKQTSMVVFYITYMGSAKSWITLRMLMFWMSHVIS